MTTKKVLFVVAHKGYQPIEYGIPKKRLEDAGFSVVTASNGADIAQAIDATTTKVDILIQDVIVEEYDGIFLVGGSGALENLDNPITHIMVAKALKEHKIVGAICIATRILAHAGILKNYKATGWNGDNELATIYQKHNAVYTPKDVVVDDHIITATGPNAAREYGEHIITLLQETKR